MWFLDKKEKKTTTAEETRQIAEIEDETLETIFKEIKELKAEIAQNRAVIELTQSIVHELRLEIAKLKETKN